MNDTEYAQQLRTIADRLDPPVTPTPNDVVPTFNVIDGELCGPVVDLHSPNQGGKVRARTGIVIHYTAGRSFNHTSRWFMRDDSDVSAHLLISRDAEDPVRQFVNFDKRAWHAGRSEYAGRRSCNGWTIGIELDNCGPVDAAGVDKWGVPQGVPIDDGEGTNNRYWMRYPNLQLLKCAQVVRALADAYPIEHVFGHQHCKSTKRDPGPAFPWGRFSDMVDMPKLRFPAKV